MVLHAYMVYCPGIETEQEKTVLLNVFNNSSFKKSSKLVMGIHSLVFTVQKSVPCPSVVKTGAIGVNADVNNL